MPEKPGYDWKSEGPNVLDFGALLNSECLIVDVRSPAEYRQGHIPGAVNMPLFSDEERAIVGITYKQQGSRAAVKEGLRLVGPRLAAMVESVEDLLKETDSDRELWLYCWRGGMRSASVAWLLQQAGFRPQTIRGGYKAFRRWALATFEQPLPLALLGGFTGCGKTHILRALQQRGLPVVDLEALACHQGSAFGQLGQPPQPTQQQFENDLAVSLRKALDLASETGRPVWLEDESRFIGSLYLPPRLWQQMLKAPLYTLPDDRERRLQNLAKDYGRFAPAELASSVLKLRKRLGPEKTAAVLAELGRGNLHNAARQLLDYYDKTYSHSMAKREGSPPVLLPQDCLEAEEAVSLLEKVKTCPVSSE